MSKRELKIDAEVVDAIVGVHCFFNDKHKVALWFNTDNLQFGGMSPATLIACGRAKKVAQYVNAALGENKTISPRKIK